MSKRYERKLSSRARPHNPWGLVVTANGCYVATPDRYREPLRPMLICPPAGGLFLACNDWVIAQLMPDGWRPSLRQFVERCKDVCRWWALGVSKYHRTTPQRREILL